MDLKKVFVGVHCYGNLDNPTSSPVELCGRAQYFENARQAVRVLQEHREITGLCLFGGQKGVNGKTEAQAALPFFQEVCPLAYECAAPCVNGIAVAKAFVYTAYKYHQKCNALLIVDTVRAPVIRFVVEDTYQDLFDQKVNAREIVFPIDRPDPSEKSTAHYQEKLLSKILEVGVKPMEAALIKGLDPLKF